MWPPSCELLGSTASLPAVLNRAVADLAAAAFLARTALTGTGRGGQSSSSLGSNILSAEAHCPLLQRPRDPGCSPCTFSDFFHTRGSGEATWSFEGHWISSVVAFTVDILFLFGLVFQVNQEKLLGVAVSGRRLKRRWNYGIWWPRKKRRQRRY